MKAGLCLYSTPFSALAGGIGHWDIPLVNCKTQDKMPEKNSSNLIAVLWQNIMYIDKCISMGQDV